MKNFIFIFLFQIFLLPVSFGAALPFSYTLEELGSNKKISWNVSDIKKPTVVFFWASWCQYCKQVLPQVKKENLKKFEIVSISCDEKKNEAIKANQREYSGMRPVYWMEKLSNQKNFVDFYPTLMIVLPGGKVDTIYEGSQGDKISYFLSRLNYLQNEML